MNKELVSNRGKGNAITGLELLTWLQKQTEQTLNEPIAIQYFDDDEFFSLTSAGLCNDDLGIVDNGSIVFRYVYTE